MRLRNLCTHQICALRMICALQTDLLNFPLFRFSSQGLRYMLYFAWIPG